MARLPQLPSLLRRKIYKTGQTRGADDDVIFQNRVGRCSTVLIGLDHVQAWLPPPNGDAVYQNGHIVLVRPEAYFDDPQIHEVFMAYNLEIGRNALVFFQSRLDWIRYDPDGRGWRPATSRRAPLGGEYVARIPATTAIEGGDRINRGFTASTGKGAGIRVFEYASAPEIDRCRVQLEAIFWLCGDVIDVVVAVGISLDSANLRRETVLQAAAEQDLLNRDLLIGSRILGPQGRTICPLCLLELSAAGFASRLVLAQGRDVPDLTVTEVNLFHIRELRHGEFNHKPYNLGWGHHHCNMVVKDAGIDPTVEWMHEVVSRNIEGGHFKPAR